MYRWFLTRAVPVINEAGKIERWIGTNTNINEQKLAEEAIKESEERFRSLANDTPAFLFTADGETNLNFVNRQWLEFVGLQEDEGFGKAWERVTHPDDVGPMHEIYLQAVKNKTSYQFEIRQKNTQGEYRWVLWNGKPRLDANGDLIGVVGIGLDITEQKRVQELVQASEERFRQMANLVPQVIWTARPDGVLDYYNQWWYDYTGEVQGKTGDNSWQPSLHPDDVERVTEVWTHSVRTGEVYQTQLRLRNAATGQYRWFFAKAVPMLDESGKIVKWFGATNDVHEQKLLEQGLRESESRFRNIFETTDVSFWEEDFSAVKAAIEELRAGGVTNFQEYFNSHPEFVQKCLGLIRVTDVNEATVKMFEAESKEEILGNLPQIFAPDTLPVFIGELLTVAEGRQSYTAECRLNTVKGNGIYTLFTMRLPDANESFEKVLFSVLDISQRKKAEETIIESESRFRTLSDTILNIVFTANETGYVNYYNQRWYDYTGYENGFGDNSWLPVLHPHDADAVAQNWYNAIQQGTNFQMEFRLKNIKTGEYRWFLSRALPVRNESGAVVKWFGSLTDVHEQKTFAEKLEQMVDLRTQDLQRSNQDLQQFAHVASHDLQEPMRKIKLFSSRLIGELGQSATEKSGFYLDKIIKSTGRMTDMINGILNYSRLNSQQQPEEAVDLSGIVRNVLIDLEVVVQEKKAQIRYGQLPCVHGIPVLLQQLFYNLINNALKFSKADVPPVIDIHSEEKAGFAEITVKDNGIGFEQEFADKIFESFTRLNPKDLYEGTGLGLSLCKKIAERHGGSIKATGKEGQGSEFCVRLPLA